MSVCFFVCLFVHLHISKTTCSNFTKSSVYVVYISGSIRLLWYCNTLCTCLVDVMFSCNGVIRRSTIAPARHYRLVCPPVGSVVYGREMSKAVNFLRPKSENSQYTRVKKTPNLQRILGRNFSNSKELNPSFRCQTKNRFRFQ